jgi:cobalamin-dependent methionine synthase I
MIIIGENVNSTRKKVAPLIEAKDAKAIISICAEQKNAGATHLDLNAAAIIGRDEELLPWLVETVQAEVDLPLSVDTTSPAAAAAALPLCKARPILNSISGEKERLAGLLPLIKEHKPCTIVMALDDQGMPKNVEDRVEKIKPTVDQLLALGLEPADLLLDPLVFPVGADQQNALIVLDSIRRFKTEFPGCNVVCGLSNVSHGLPARKFINQAFLVMCVQAGMSAVIINPLDHYIMALLQAALALTNQDEFCMDYIKANEDGKLNIKTILE